MKNEWPLLVFTLLAEAGVGVFLVSRIVFIRRNKTGKPDSLLKASLLTGFALVLGAAFFSLFHLGRPERAYLAVLHILNSGLSREIFWMMWVLAGMGFLLLLSPVMRRRPKLRNFVTAATWAGGIMLIWNMARLYMLPTVPVWNTPATLVSFFLTAFILGGVLFLNLTLSKADPGVSLIFDSAGGVFALIILQAGLFSLWGPGWGLFAPAGPPPPWSLLDPAAAVRIASLLAGAFLLLRLRRFLREQQSRRSARWTAAAASFFILLGETAGRWIFYASFSRLGL
ncbi:MAG: DmsC/YnfH family molybdoenzyme membrane anchor subunit [Candidatus Aminicenantes bacterium]